MLCISKIHPYRTYLAKACKKETQFGGRLHTGGNLKLKTKTDSQIYFHQIHFHIYSFPMFMAISALLV